jgi:acyl carrier protein
VEWTPVPVADHAPGSFAVLGTDHFGLASGLAAAGADVTTAADVAALAEAAGQAGGLPEFVLASLSGPETGAGENIADTVPADTVPADTALTARRLTGSALRLLQEWLAHEELAAARLVIVTRGAVQAAPGEDVTDLAAAAARGLVRSAQSENPGRLILADLPSGSGAGSSGAEESAEAGAVPLLAAALVSGEPALAVRGQSAYGQRLVRPVWPASQDTVLDTTGLDTTGLDTTGPDTAGPETAASEATGPEATGPVPAGTALVTGGTGLLGGLVARHLAETGRAARVLLTSRSGPAAAGAAVLAAEIAGAGAGVQVIACDAADRDPLAAVLAAIPAEVPLTGVIHAAGVLDDGVTASLTQARLDAVMRPKADAAWNLHELTAGHRLGAFVLFSSGAAAFGAAGQGNYAAGNAFLDALAGHRRAAGLPGVSLGWGLWADASGLTSGLADRDRARMTRGGINPLTADEGLALLDAAMDREEAQLLPMRLDVTGLRAQIVRAGADVPHLLRSLIAAVARSQATAPDQASAAEALRRQLAALSADDRDRVLTSTVRAHVAAILGHASQDAIEPSRPFSELGFDSLTAVELRNRLAAATGLTLPATVVFDYPTPAELAAQLLTVLIPVARAETAEDQAEAEIRKALASVPLSLLRNAGLLDSILKLAGAAPDAADANPAEAADSIREMSVEDLIKTARKRSQSASSTDNKAGE